MLPLTVVTDSSACVAPGWPDAALRVLPLGLITAEGRLADGPAAAPAVAAALAAGDVVRTVAPSPVEYLHALDACPGGAVVVTPAADVAVMYRNATLAARLHGGHGGEVVVVDCGTAGPAHGLCVVSGLRAAAGGAGPTEVAGAVMAAARRARLVAVIPDLARVGGSAGQRPPMSAPGQPGLPTGGPGGPMVFRFHDGVPVPVRDGTGEPDDPVETLLAAWRGARGPDAAEAVVFHAGDEAGAAQLCARMDDGARSPTIVPISPAMAVHTGPGCVGVAWLSQDP